MKINERVEAVRKRERERELYFRKIKEKIINVYNKKDSIKPKKNRFECCLFCVYKYINDTS